MSIKGFYEYYWERRVKAHGTKPSGMAIYRADYVAALLPQVQSLGKVLDAGCGDGATLHYLSKKFQFESYGIDIAEQAVELARTRKIKAEVADISERIPFPDTFFDVVICSEVLEHLPLPSKALAEMRRVAKDAAVFIFSVPNIATIGKRIRFIFGKTIFEQGRFSSDEHLHYWTKSSFIALLKENGFIIVRVKGELVGLGRLFRKDTLVSGTLFTEAKKCLIE